MADEARLHALLDVYEQAKAEGDTDTMTKVAAAYKLESAPAQAPGRPANVGGRGQVVTPEMLQTPGGKPLDVAGGIAAANPVPILRQFAAGASRLATKPGELATAGAQAVGVPGANVADYNQGVAGLENDIAGTKDQSGRGFGELAAGLAAPASKAAEAATMLKATLEGAKTGAVVGGALSPTGQETTPGEVGSNLARGAGLGAATGGVLAGGASIGPGIRNVIVRLADAAKPVKEAAAQIAEKAKSILFRDIPSTLGAKTGSPVLLALEQKVAGKRATDFNNNSLDKFGTAVDAMTAAQKGSADPLSAAIKMKETFGRSVAGLQNAASKEYGDGMAAVRAVAAKDPNRFRVPMDGFEQALNDAQANIGGQAKPRSKWYSFIAPKTLEADPALQEALDYIGEIRARDPSEGISVDEIIRLKQAANTMRRGLKSGRDLTAGQAEQNRIGRGIANGIDKDIDSFLGQYNGTPAIPGQSDPTRQALQMLGEVNDRYKTRLGQLADKKNSFVAQVFGRAVPEDPAKQWEAFMRLDPGQQIRGLNLLREANPELLDNLKAWKLQDVARKIRNQTKPGNESPIDVKAYLDELTNGSDVVGQRMWTPRELQDIKSGIAAARTLRMAGSSNIGAPDIGRVGAAAATRSTPFVLMQYYNIVSRGHIEKLLFTERGINALQQISKTYRQPTADTIKNLSILQDLVTSPDDQQ